MGQLWPASRRGIGLAACLLSVLTTHHGVSTQELQGPGDTSEAARSSDLLSKLVPTAHPPVPLDPARLWLVSAKSTSPVLTDFARGVRLVAAGSYEQALPLLSAPGLASTPLADYARYYAAHAYLQLDRRDRADEAL